MIVEALKAVFSNLQTFFGIWIIVILINQIFIFGACFAPYCLAAALPHTGIISVILTYLVIKEKSKENQ